jgi:hypothetical protein
MSTNNSNGIQQNGVHQQQQQDFDLIVFGSIVQDLVSFIDKNNGLFCHKI